MVEVIGLEGEEDLRGLCPFLVDCLDGEYCSVAHRLYELAVLGLIGLPSFMVLVPFFFFPFSFLVSFLAIADFTVFTISTFENGSTGEMPEINSS